MKRAVGLLLFLSLFTLDANAAKRAFTIEDFYRVKTIGALDLSPDGKRIAFDVTTSDLPRGTRSTQIWMMASDGTDRRQLTSGEKSSSGPRFSPDGKSLFFVSSRDGSQQLYRLPLDGGEAKKVTSVEGGISDPLLTPDGKQVVFSSDVYPECKGDQRCNERTAKRWEDGPLRAHMADTLLYRHWTDWKDGKRTHTFVAGLDGGKARELTTGDFDAPGFQVSGPLQYDVSPDGKELVVVSNRDPHPASSTNSDLWLLSLDGSSEPRNITGANRAWDGNPKYSPDGKYIAYRTQRDPGYESSRSLLNVYERSTGKIITLTETFNDWVEDYEWSDDSRSIVFTGPVQGTNPLLRVDLATKKIDTIYADRTIDAFELTKDGSTVFYIGRSVGEPSEIYTARAGSTSRKALTDFNAQLMREVDVRPAESMWVDVGGGRKIHLFIVKPHGFDPSKKYPLIVNVHGGPQSQWADSFRGDWQVYPGAGYIVAFPNPTGSTGYGQELTAAISGDWGGRVYEEVMKVTDALEKLPYVDRNRIGAMGWSYGGYFMNWLLGHTDRFKAIASMMGLYDLRSFYGATEELWFPEWDLKGQPWNSDLYEKWSPSNYVKNFKTPTLVITGEKDYRVPYTQSLQLFTALQKMNVPSRLIVFPDAGHWPGWYEMALYYTAHLEWFEKYLGGGGPPWSTEAFLRNAVFDRETGERLKDGEK